MKKIILSAKEIIITYILQYLLIIILCLFYTLLGGKNLTKFINTYCSIFLLIFYIIITIYLYNKNKITEPNLNKKYYFPLISIGISIACLLNMVIFIIHKNTITSNLSNLFLLISSGIIGPIYEEVLFRYIFLNKLKQFNTTKKAIIINSLIFALIHITPIKICYAFILGLILNITYQKYKNIKAPIIIHISANIIVLFISTFNIYILVLSFIILLLNKKYII